MMMHFQLNRATASSCRYYAQALLDLSSTTPNKTLFSHNQPKDRESVSTTRTGYAFF